MNIPYYTLEELRAMLNEELDKRFGPIGSCRNFSPASARAEEDELVDSKEAARILGCTTRTIASYRARKLFRVVFRGPHKAMYWRSELEAFRLANTRPSRDSK